jgi:hypothetical protein
MPVNGGGTSGSRNKVFGEEYMRRKVRKEPCLSKERGRAYAYYFSF